jgi:16S rRNA (adenine1518-N6/adenine1519-N6)-dimethyltransferase
VGGVTEGELAFEDPRRVLARHGLHAKRSYSQNFLVSRHALEGIAAALAPAPQELVVELGPGLGTLTAALLRRGARVLAVEADPDMREVLAAELGSQPGLQILAGDARTVDLRDVARSEGKPVALAGNLPYAVTGSILRHLVDQRDALSRAVIMVQREVRDRLLASPSSKAYGALTVFVSAAFALEPVLLVKPGAFFPPPKVSSAVVRLTTRPEPLAREDDAFRTVVRALFDARRKTCRNALLQVVGDATLVDAALTRAGVDGRARGETLDLTTMDAIADELRQRRFVPTR